MNSTNADLKKMHKAFGFIEMATSGATLSQAERVVVTEGVAAFVEWTHAAQVQAGWWQDPETGQRVVRNVFELHALFHSGVSEAMEAHRKNNRMDDKLPNRRGLGVELAQRGGSAHERVASPAPGTPIAFAPLSAPPQGL